MGAIDTIREFNDRLRGAMTDRGGYRSASTNTPKADNSLNRQNQVVARSGGNIGFMGDTGLSENYKNALNNAIKFYQGEFKVTPNALISDMTDAPVSASGITYLYDVSNDGKRRVELRRLKETDEEEALRHAQHDVKSGWSAKNSGDIAHVPVHELGHVLADMFLPYNKDTSSNSVNRNDEHSWKAMRELYNDALKDVGVDTTAKTVEEKTAKKRDALNKVREIAGYAAAAGEDEFKLGNKVALSDPDQYEVIAEALSDYYYNRDGAAPLSKAIVKRLKNKGAMYGIQRTGGVDLNSSSKNFIKNLRRYSAIQ